LNDFTSRVSVLFRGRWLLLTIAVILLVALFLRLGFWQLERRAERRAANALLLQRLEQSPIALDGGPVNPDQANLRRAIVRGSYDYDQEIILRNRALNELPGVHVITPLRIAGSQAAVLVDRGWIPYEMSSPELRAKFERPIGLVEVQGFVRGSQVRPSVLAPADPPLSPDRPRLDAWHRVDVARIQQQVSYPLLPIFVEVEDPLQREKTAPQSTLQDESGQHFPRPVLEVELSEGSHLFYALQWFAFAAILAVGHALLCRRQLDNVRLGG
jgi:surfeit locus 1 family protein